MNSVCVYGGAEKLKPCIDYFLSNHAVQTIPLDLEINPEQVIQEAKATNFFFFLESWDKKVMSFLTSLPKECENLHMFFYHLPDIEQFQIMIHLRKELGINLYFDSFFSLYYFKDIAKKTITQPIEYLLLECSMREQVIGQEIIKNFIMLSHHSVKHSVRKEIKHTSDLVCTQLIEYIDSSLSQIIVKKDTKNELVLTFFTKSQKIEFSIHTNVMTISGLANSPEKKDIDKVQIFRNFSETKNIITFFDKLYQVKHQNNINFDIELMYY